MELIMKEKLHRQNAQALVRQLSAAQLKALIGDPDALSRRGTTTEALKAAMPAPPKTKKKGGS
jgi:hypothetical protein